MSLFRKEASRRPNYKQGSNLDVSFEVDRQRSVLAVVSLVLVALLLTLMFVGEYKRRVKITGRVATSQGSVRLVAPSTGILGDFHVKEGQEVQRGDTLGRLNAERSTADLAVDRSDLRLLEQQVTLLDDQLQASRTSYEAQRLKLENSARTAAEIVSQLGAQLDIDTRRERIAESAFVNYKKLASEGFISDVQLSTKEEEWLIQKSRLTGLRREKANAEINLANADSELSVLRSQAEIEAGKLRGSISNLNRQIGESKLKIDSRILAPISGIVTAIQAVEGQPISQNSIILTIVPADTPLEARALVPSAAMGFLQRGQDVSLHYLAFPYQKFGHHRGRIKSFNVASIVDRTDQKPDSPAQQDSIYEVVIELSSQQLTAHGEQKRIYPDMQFEADVVTESRTIFEWIFEPLYAVARR